MQKRHIVPAKAWQRLALRLHVLLVLDVVVGWHAFVGQEAVPTISGTSLSSSLPLPAISSVSSIGSCDAALTSLRKITGGRLCLRDQGMCTLACAVAWGSLLREFEAVTGQLCEELKAALKQWRPDLKIVDSEFLGGVGSPVSAEEGVRLSDACATSYKCPDHHCNRKDATLGDDGTSSAPEYSSLAPSVDQCEGFEVIDGTQTLSFLTWKSLHLSYMSKAIGCSGGLSNATADAEHTTWACIHQPKCTTSDLPKGDLACFKYSHIRGEFHFWGWNRALSLVPPLFEVEVSFCDPIQDQASSGYRRIVDAITGVQRSVYESAFRIVDYDSQGRATSVALQEGTLDHLGADGCNPFRLQGDINVQLLITSAGFVNFQSRVYIPRAGGTLPAALLPLAASQVDQLGAGLGLVLEWGRGPKNLDLWITVPVAAREGNDEWKRLEEATAAAMRDHDVDGDDGFNEQEWRTHLNERHGALLAVKSGICSDAGFEEECGREQADSQGLATASCFELVKKHWQNSAECDKTWTNKGSVTLACKASVGFPCDVETVARMAAQGVFGLADGNKDGNIGREEYRVWLERGERPFFSCFSDAQEIDEDDGSSKVVRTWFELADGALSAAECLQSGGVWERVEPWEGDDNAALYWDGPRYAVSACPVPWAPGFDPGCVAGVVALTITGQEGFGPETILVRGVPPDGQYRVYAHVYSGHPDSTFEMPGEIAARLTAYSQMYATGPLFAYEVGEHTWRKKDGNWWHVVNLLVQDGFVYEQNVDRIVYGYTSVPSRTTVPPSWDGPKTALTRTSPVKNETKLLQWSRRQGRFVVMLKLFPHVQSIVDESQALLQGATYSVRTGSEVIVGPGASVAAASQAGIDLPPGEYQLVISAAMFVDLEVAVSMRAASDRRKRQSFWMVPADNQARAVLRWHTTPLQLDLYVVPIATGIAWKDATGHEVSSAHVGPQSPLLEQGLSRIAVERWSAPRPEQVGLGSNGEEYGPKSITISNAAPGQYRVYVQAPPLGGQLFDSQMLQGGGGQQRGGESVYVDIYIDALLHSTLKYEEQAATKWWFVGYFLAVPSGALSWVAESRVVTLYNPIDRAVSPLIPLTLTVKYMREFSDKLDFTNAKYEVLRVEAAAEAACAKRTLCGLTCEQIFQEVGIAMCYQSVAGLEPSIDPTDTCTAASIPPGFNASSPIADVCPRVCKHRPCSDYRATNRGTVGPDITPCLAGEECPDTTWTQQSHNVIYLPAGSFMLTVDLDGFVRHFLPLEIPPQLATASKTILMVDLPASPKEIIVVLDWGKVPWDLDLWVVKGGGEEEESSTYWAERGPNGGVRLDLDNTESFGPETVTFTANTFPGVYRVAVNVYSANGDLDCVGNDEDPDICRFAGNETVSFYGTHEPGNAQATFSGLLARSVMPVSKVKAEKESQYAQGTAHSWWLAGIVTRQANGNSLIKTNTMEFPNKAPSQNLDTTCADLQLPTGATNRACGGDFYCCPDVGCTSNCGACNNCDRRRRAGSQVRTKAVVSK